MQLSIIIVNHNAEKFLEECLSSIIKNTQQVDFEIIVIDNNSKNSCAALIKNSFKQASLIENKENLGFAKAVNQGMRFAKSEFILLLNNDVTVLPQSINKLLQFMESCPDAMAAGGKVLNPDGTLQFSCRRFTTFFTALFNRRSFLTRIFKNNRFSRSYLMSDWPHDKTYKVDWISACCLIIRKEALEKVGFMDEDFFMYCEDVDWCYRAKQKDYRVYYFPEAKFFHRCNNSKKLDCSKTIWHHRSMYKFYKKHYSKFFIMDILVAAALMGRMIFLLTISFFR